MRKFSTVLATIFLLNLAIFFVAESSPTTENAIRSDDIIEKFSKMTSPWEYDTFKVGYVKNTGFMTEDRPGHWIGYGYEYMEFLENYAHCRFEYVEFADWDEMSAALTNKTIDLMPGMPGDYRKVENAARTDHVIGRFPMELVVSGGVIRPHMKIGTVPMSYPTPGFAGIAKGEGFTYEEISFPKFQQMMEAYHKSEIDGYVDAMLSHKHSSNIVALFDRQSYRLIVHADNKELLERMNVSMDQMLLIQPDIRDKLSQRYVLTDGFPLILSKAEKEYLAARKKLKAAIFIHYQPFAYYDENKNLVGLMPELIKRIERDLNIEIEIVETSSVGETHDLIQSGGVDIAVDSLVDHSWGEAANIKPTQSYLTMEYAAVTRAGYELDNSKQPIVACVPNMLSTKNFIQPNFPENKILYFDTWQECLKAVNDGRADVVYMYKSTFLPLMNETGTYGLEISPITYYTEPVCLGIYAYENSQLWHIFNKELNHIDDSWIIDVLNEHIHATANVGITPMWLMYHHPTRVVAFITLLAIAIGSFIIYRNKMKQRHFELVQHMAYTDLRYNLHNVSWLEKEIPNTYAQLKKVEPEIKTFFVIFSMESGATVAEEFGRKMIDKKFKELAKELETAEPVICTAAGIDVEHLICFCKAESVEKIFNWAEGIVQKYSYMDTANAQAKVVLHTKAGITNYTPQLYIQQAVDRALSACHIKSNDSVKIFDEKMEENLTTQHMIESRMEQALRDGEFKAFYQPKYDLRTRKIIGAEALVRWISPETGFMPPGKFIPLFEENGFVIQVDYYILEKTFQLQKERLEAGKEVIPISVNQSRLHMTEENYLEKMKAIVEKYNLPKGLIELEITETMFGDFDNKASQKNAEKIVQGLHDLGFSLSVDDFGSGYSSFTLLGSLPMEVMKIDRSVLTGADTSQRMKEILSYVIDLGHALRMEVLCEGIETREQEILLMDLGCNIGQGFFNAKPMPVEDFVNFFEKRNAEVAAGTVEIPA